jgi:hypothetical protein
MGPVPGETNPTLIRGYAPEFTSAGAFRMRRRLAVYRGTPVRL